MKSVTLLVKITGAAQERINNYVRVLKELSDMSIPAGTTRIVASDAAADTVEIQVVACSDAHLSAALIDVRGLLVVESVEVFHRPSRSGSGGNVLQFPAKNTPA